MKTIDTTRARDAWELLKHLDALEAAVTEYNNSPTTMTTTENNMEEYRLDTAYGSLYRYSEDQDAYLFVSRTATRNLRAAIAEYHNACDAEFADRDSYFASYDNGE